MQQKNNYGDVFRDKTRIIATVTISLVKVVMLDHQQQLSKKEIVIVSNYLSCG